MPTLKQELEQEITEWGLVIKRVNSQRELLKDDVHIHKLLYLEAMECQAKSNIEHIKTKLKESVPAETLVSGKLADFATIEEATKTYCDSLDLLRKQYYTELKIICKKQKEICANAARTEKINGQIFVKRTSILNAPSAWKDDSKFSR
jgi:hypothetical protein